MNKISVSLLLLFVMFISCNSGTSKSKSQDKLMTEQEEAIKKAANTDITDCDEFLDRYEKWVDDYLVVMEKYMKNPLDTALSQEYLKVAQEGMEWFAQWSNNHFECTQKEKYQKRFDKISEKVDKKMKELGLE